MLDLSRLNPPQREAVQTIEGPLLVLAGAGSGKTRVIVHRIAYMIERGIAPTSILAVTFTNKAAAEMRERVGALVGRQAERELTVCTFHAFGCQVLRAHLHRLGYPRRFAIADASDQLALVKKALREVKVDDRSFDARRVLAEISRAKCAGVEPQPLPEGQGDDYDLVVSRVFPRYQKALKAQGAVDFDDLILLPARLMREHAEVRKALQDRFRYLLVDEYQDTNRAQLELLELLAGERRNVCAVGDDDQSIYSWRGAEVEGILAFERRFPGAREIRLEQNYRSTQSVLDAANAVIAKNPARKPKRLWTAQGAGEPIRLAICADEDEEGRFIARQIAELIGRGRRPSDIAVLYRTNLQSRPVEEALRGENVPYRVVGGQEFFDRREIRDLWAYLKVCDSRRDDVSLLRIANVPPRGIGDVTLERLLAHANALGISVEEAMRRAASFSDLPQGAAARIGELLALLERYRARFRREPIDQVARDLVREIGLEEMARLSVKSAAAGARKAQAIEGFLDSLTAFVRREGSDLHQLLQRLALDARDDDSGPEAPAVSLMTLHAAKGLEWPVVFLCGLEEGLLPHAGMPGEAQNLDEERRLAYVGITRAREQLFLTRAAQRIKRGKAVPRAPSRFLEEIPKEILQVTDQLAVPQGPAGQEEKAFFSELRARLRSK